MKNHLGQHWLIEYYECEASLLSDPDFLERVMREAAEVMNATIVTSTFHHFSPLGVSGVVVIQESHLTIHSWPEYEYAAVDIFTCGEIDMEAGVDFLKEKMKAGKMEIIKEKRGKNLLINNPRFINDSQSQ